MVADQLVRSRLRILHVPDGSLGITFRDYLEPPESRDAAAKIYGISNVVC